MKTQTLLARTIHPQIGDSKISSREKEILHLISLGLTTTDIASSLYISHETVRSHRKNLLSKLSANNAAVLVRRGYESGLIS